MTAKNLEQKTEKGFARGLGEGMYSGVGRLGALFSVPMDSGESFRECWDNIIKIHRDNSSPYRIGFISGEVTGYTIALTAGAMLSGAGLVLLNRYFNQ